LKIEDLTTVLRTAGEAQRLRILALCADDDLSVSELTKILGLSQPSVSRHLRSLSDTGLLQRHQEGSWAYFHFPRAGTAAEIARLLVGWMDENCPLLVRDRRRLEDIRQERATRSERYFRDNAQRWDQIRALYVEEERIEAAIGNLTDGLSIGKMLDIGTGTGRMLQLFANQVQEAVGIDLSHNMLSFARVNLSQPQFSRCSVRHSDMYSLPFDTPSFDLITLHMVLHFADRPQDVIAEAARVIMTDGHLLIVGFAPHDRQELIEKHAHLRLGVDTDEVNSWALTHDFTIIKSLTLPEGQLTVNLWLLRKNRPQRLTTDNPTQTSREVG